MPTTTRSTAELLREVRRMPIFRQLVPSEAGIGWPLPARKDGRVYITVPFFGMPTTGAKGYQPLYPPFSVLTLDWRTGRPVAFLDLRYRSPWQRVDGPVGHFPHEGIKSMTRREYLDRREELLRLYDELLETLITEGTFEPEWTDRFSELLKLLVEPGLEPYYRALAPKFTARFLGEVKRSNGGESTA
jgi:hypothetical protein